MTRRCLITEKGPQSGNNVSHAKNRTRRKFNPNLQNASLYSELLDRSFAVKVSVAGLRTLDHKGGLDAYLLATAPSKLPADLRPLKAQVVAAAAKKAAA